MDYDIAGSYNEENGSWEITLTGEFDIFNSVNLKNELNKFIEENNADLVLDCDTLSYMDSTSIGSLVAVLKNVKAYGGKVVLRELKPNLLKLFRITNLNKVFEIEGEANDRDE